MRVVIAHGGTTSTPKDRLGTRKAAKAGLAVIDSGPLEAVVEAVRVLEDDERFHAGRGSTYRMDGRTIELDAGVSCSDGRYGGVSGLERFRNPVLVARALADLPTNVVAGEGANVFARRLGLPDEDLRTKAAEREWRKSMRKVETGKAGPDENEWLEEELRRVWNYERPFDEVFPRGFRPPAKTGGMSRTSDTVGAVATDGETFAAAASTAGMMTTLRGRLGDAAVLGAGIYATEHGAVACSGNGDHIFRALLSVQVLRWVEEGGSPKDVAKRAVAQFPKAVDAAVVLVTKDGHAGHGNRSFAYSVARA